MTKEQFEALPKNEQRVILAKDIVAQIQAGKYKPTNMSFFGIKTKEGGLVSYRPEENAQAKIKENVCHVCAKASVVCAYIERFNERTFGEISTDAFKEQKKNFKEFRSLFGPRGWDKIECLFEGWPLNIRNSNGMMENAIYNLIPLEDIMLNIIKNNGHGIKGERRREVGLYEDVKARLNKYEFSFDD